MRSSCVQTLNEGGNTSKSAASNRNCGQNIQNIVIGNLSSVKDSSNEGKTVVGLEKFNPSEDINPIKCPTRNKEKSFESQVEHKNRFKTDPKLGSDVLDLYPSKCSFFKDCEEEEASNFSSERLIEEIEVDSVLSLNLDEDSHLRDSDEGRFNLSLSLSKCYTHRYSWLIKLNISDH